MNNPGSSFVNIIIYDLIGREIVILVNERLNSGTYQVEWDANNFPVEFITIPYSK